MSALGKHSKVHLLYNLHSTASALQPPPYNLQPTLHNLHLHSIAPALYPTAYSLQPTAYCPLSALRSISKFCRLGRYKGIR